MATNGTNVWHDLMTTDAEGARRFYAETVGWKTKAWENADPKMPYTLWMAGEQAIGGVMPLPDQAKAMGAPAHWLAYTTVENVDAAVEKAKTLGAKVYRAPTNIPTVGRFSVLADPQGATFAVFTPESDMAAKHEDVGNFSWAELVTKDYEAAWKFYSELFGWEHRSTMDMGEAGAYFMFNDPTKVTKGGMSNMAAQTNMPPHWLHYVTVDDIDAAVARVTANGGKIMNGPMDVPGGDRVAQCMDPQGGAFAVYAEGEK